MAVMDLDEVYFCCLYGNTEDEVIIRHITRDKQIEEEMVFLEQCFWMDHVKKRLPPPFTEDGELIIATSRKYSGLADTNAPVVSLNLTMTAALMRYLQLREEKKNSEKFTKQLESEMDRLKATLIAEMGPSCTATCDQDGQRYMITYNPVRKPMIEKDILINEVFSEGDLFLLYVFFTSR